MSKKKTPAKKIPADTMPKWIQNDSAEVRFMDATETLHLAAELCSWLGANNGTKISESVLHKLENVFDQAADDFGRFVDQLPKEIQFWHVGQPIQIEVGDHKIGDQKGGGR